MTQHRIRSIERCLDILEYLSDKEEPVHLDEIVSQLGLAKTTAHNILRTMMTRGYVAHVAARKGYVLGEAALRLGQDKNRQSLKKVAEPYLKKLSELVDRESCYFVTFTGFQFVNQVFIESPQFLSTKALDESDTDLHTLSIGKILLSHLTPAECDQWIRMHGLTKVTEYTITERDQLLKELAEVRKKGFAETHEEKVLGVSTLATGVKGRQNKTIGAIAIGVPSIRLTKEKKMRYVAEMKKISQLLSEKLKDSPVY